MPKLYEFQQEDVHKLVQRSACLIGSEMATGKTLEAIALDELWNPKATRPTLVVAPLNTFDSWREKYHEQSPTSDVVVIDRKDRSSFVDAIRRKQGDVFVMHWDALRVTPELRQFYFNTIIADEAHRASNRKAQATLALKKLATEHKLAMSGTLTGDKPENLWSTLNWLYPKEYPSYWRFRKHHCVEQLVPTAGNPHGYTQIVGVQNIPELMHKIEPFYVRHLKREACCPHHPEGVMSWLPDVTHDRIWVDLSPQQRRVYEEMRKEMVAWVGEHEDSPLVAGVVVAQMVRLSQIALATPFIDESSGAIQLSMPSSKISACMELLNDHPDKQFVVFSASKKACYLAAQEFERVGITAEVLSGDTPDSQRAGMVRRFNDGGFRVFIGVIAAAAEGIDGLQHTCDTGIFLDRSWSTIKNKQAEERLDRPGQKNATNIIDIMARGTLDFGRYQRLELKWSWIKSILGDPVAAQHKYAEEK